jgi:endonuclease YncB( thermonuclease family)
MAALWLMLAVLASQARAADSLPGPVTADVLRTIDGDTIEVQARVWLGMDVTSKIRVRGIDAPEIHGRCEHEKAMARDATTRLAALVAGGAVVLRNIAGDKYFGRVLADVVTGDGKDVAEQMLASGLARPYDGGKRGDWCNLASLGG